MKKDQIFNLDQEEKDILDSVEQGEWVSVSGAKILTQEAKSAAREYLKKDARINIRISSKDLDLIKQIAVYEGLSYQTLIASVLHKFARKH